MSGPHNHYKILQFRHHIAAYKILQFLYYSTFVLLLNMVL